MHIYDRATGEDLTFTLPATENVKPYGETSLAPLTPGLLIDDVHYFEFCSAMHGIAGSEYDLYMFDIPTRSLEIVASDVKNPSFWPHSDGRYVLLEDYENMDHKILYDMDRDLLVDIDLPAEVSFLGFADDRMIFQPVDVRSADSGWFSTPADYDSMLYWVELE